MVSVQALAQESNTQKTRPQKGKKVSFQIRENPNAARHKQKAIWQPLTGQAFSFFSSPVAMETVIVCPPSRGRWALRACGARRGKAFAKQNKPTPDLCLQGHEGLGAARWPGRGAGQRPTATHSDAQGRWVGGNCSVFLLTLWVTTKRCSQPGCWWCRCSPGSSSPFPI